MKLSSLRVKVTGTVLICLAAAAAAILMVLHVNFNHQADQMTRDAVAEAQQLFRNLEAADVNKMSVVLEALLDNDAYQGAYTEAHRKQLYDRGKAFFERMKSDYHFTLWQFNNPESRGTVFLRMHRPEGFGDPLKRWMYEECVRTKAPVAGKELGHSGFALRVMMPQRDQQGNILGYVEVGEEIGRFFSAMQVETGNQYGIALKKTLLQKDKWADFRKSRGLLNNWDDMRDMVVGDRTTENEQLMNVQADIDAIPDEGQVLGRISSGGGTYVRGVFPVTAADGQRAGAVFVVKDMTSAFANLRGLELKVAGLIVAITLLICIVVSAMLERWVFRRLDHMIEMATLVVGGDYECVISKSADDEVGQFEYLFDQFRKVFLSLAKKHQSQGTTARA